MINEPPRLTIRRNFPRPTAEQLAAFDGVQTGFVCDALGGTGGMETSICPVAPGLHAFGVAVVADNGPEEILATIGAMQIMQPGDIVVAGTRDCQSCAAAGDQFMGLLRNNGAAGFVTDGAMRDLEGIIEVGLPAWCKGLNPNSPYSNGPGRAGFGAVVGGQMVNSGDIIVADSNGVVVVPFDQIDRVIAALANVLAAEVTLDAEVKAGRTEMPILAEMLADGRAIVVD